jgi:hypothetical protein
MVISDARAILRTGWFDSPCPHSASRKVGFFVLYVWAHPGFHAAQHIVVCELSLPPSLPPPIVLGIQWK